MTNSNPTLTPEKSPRAKIGWRYMMAGLVITLSAGAAYYMAPRSTNPALYGTIGNYLMATGLVVYVVGRVLRWRGRAKP